jgi:hypothetical protein
LTAAESVSISKVVVGAYRRVGWINKEAQMRALFAATVALLLLSVPAFAQQQCLHGSNEDAIQKARRLAGLTLVRAINTAEANEGTVKAKRYLPLAELTVDLTKAPGFEAQFTTDGKTYSFILKDTADPCHFVFSTNQLGIIFQGYPIDWGVQPVAKSPAK